MDIVVSQEKGSKPVTVFTITGAVDSSNYTQLEDKAREAHAAGTQYLVLDLANSEYVSSAGIRAINVILKMLKGDLPQDSDEAMSSGLRDGSWRSPHLKLANVNHRVAEAFKIAGVDMLVDMHSDLKKAIASF
jgi:hypothetical protein